MHPWSLFMRPATRSARSTALAITALLGLLWGPSPEAAAITLVDDEESGRHFSIFGYTQPFFQFVQDPCIQVPSNPSECTVTHAPSGFGLSTTRFGFQGGQDGLASFHVEVSTDPNLVVIESQLNVHLPAGFTYRLGLYRVAFSGQELISESRLQLNRSELIRATPGRQLGTSLRFEMPRGLIGELPESFVVAEFGVFNGESAKARAPVMNIDSNFLFGGRVEVNPFGYSGTRYEGDLRPRAERSEPLLSVGGNFYTNTSDGDDFEESGYGADATFKLHGLSLYLEYYRRDRNYFSSAAGTDQFAYGWNSQLGYVLPWERPGLQFEIVGRVEQYDPATAARDEDAQNLVPRAPGAGPAAPERLQAQRTYIGGLNWYIRGHDFKVQARYSHRVAQEDYTDSARSPEIDRNVQDDDFMLIATYRF